MSATIATALALATRRLADAGVASAALDARVILGHVLGAGPEMLVGGERGLEATDVARYEALIARRARHEPTAYVVGEREFWSLAFTVTAATLTPRPETETLVGAVLDRVDRGRPLSLLDLGTGTGCLLLALLAELPAAHGTGVDLSEAAVRVAQGNAARLGLGARAGFVVGDWSRAIGGVFDVVVANPPYVATGELDGLAPEVRAEPILALDGGADGLDAVRAIVPALPELVAEDGLAALEVGAGQAPAVEAMLASLGEGAVETVDDLAGIARCVLLKRPGRGKISLGNAPDVG